MYGVLQAPHGLASLYVMSHDGAAFYFCITVILFMDRPEYFGRRRAEMAIWGAFFMILAQMFA